MLALRFLAYWVRHKWHVAVAGRRLRLPYWRLLIHDWSKLTPKEFWPNVRHHAGLATKTEIATMREMHWRRNDHHWQHWNGAEMPEVAVREMVADWISAGIAKGDPGTVHDWYAVNAERIGISHATRTRVAVVLRELRRDPSH
jgi:hypothetical protein